MLAELGYAALDALIDAAVPPGIRTSIDLLPPAATEAVVELPGRGTVEIGLHDHREQRLVDPDAAAQAARGSSSRPMASGPGVRGRQWSS